MRSNHTRGRTAILLLVVVLIAALVGGADAKKRRKKHKKHRRHQPIPTTVSEPAHAVSSVQAPHGVSNCEPVKEQYRQVIQKYSAVNKDVVEKHNKLVTEYNVLLKSHSELIKKFNTLVTELEDPALATFLAAKAVKAYHHPGIEGAVNKTYVHVLPATAGFLSLGQTRGAEWFNKTQISVQQFLESYGGEGSNEWAPAISGWIVYGSVLIPVSISCWCVLEFVCKLHQLILFGHVYLAVTGILMAGFAMSTGEDPLSTFAEQDFKLYQFAQCAFAIVFLAYGLTSSVALCCTDGNGVWRTLHVLVVMSFGALYYLLIWTPAMLDELPRVDDFVESLILPEIPVTDKTPGKEDEEVPVLLTVAPYLVVAVVFSMLFLFESSSSKAVRPEDEEHHD